MKHLCWILQTNLIKPAVADAIRAALAIDNIDCQEVKIIPFSDELPGMSLEPDTFYVVYGSTTLILNAAKDSRLCTGVFFDPELFNTENYIRKWGTRMLNHDSRLTTLSALAAEAHDIASEWFLRPNEDDKSFSGAVMTFEEIRQFTQNLQDSNNPSLTPETLISVSAPKTIEKEWRHFIVDKKVVNSGRYMLHGELAISSEDIPEALVQFVEDSCEIYSPHAIFVMDTALYNGEFRIIECNCFNGTGFYSHDIQTIVREVDAFLLRLEV